MAGAGHRGAITALGVSDLQTGRPLVSTEPWRSNSKVIVSMIGGGLPDTVSILPPP